MCSNQNKEYEHVQSWQMKLSSCCCCSVQSVCLSFVCAVSSCCVLTQLPLLDVSLETLPAISGIFLATYVLCCNLNVIFTGGVGKNGSSVAVSLV